MPLTNLFKRWLSGWSTFANTAVQEPHRPRDALLHDAHGHFDLGRYSQALAVYTTLIETAAPDSEGLFKLYVNAGNCHELLGKVDDAIRCYVTALNLHPACIEANWNLAALYRRLGKEHLAIPHQQWLEQAQLSPALRMREILDIPVIASSTDAIIHWRSRFATQLSTLAAIPSGTIEQPETSINATPLYLAYQGQDNAELTRLVCAAVRRFYATPPFVHAQRPQRKRIRIGFVSPFFFNHSIGRLYRGVIGALDRSRFEVFVFSINHQKDETAKTIENHADYFFALPEHILTVTAAIRQQQLDVLYYPEIGLHPVTYFLAYWRLAPVQCMSYGHPDTSGIDTIDYFLSAGSIEPAAHQTYYTEKLVRLDGFFMPAYERPEFPHIPARAERFGAEPGQRIYFCPQTLFKFHPDFDFILRQILTRDPSAILTLIDAGPSDWKPALMRRFAQTMPDTVSRIRFIPAQSTAEYVNLLRSADAVLDTVYFGGGISVMDTFAANVPIVTLEGQFFRGRQAAACYREMGMDDCISDSPEAYIDRALLIARDPLVKVKLSERIAQTSSRLFNRVEAIRSLEEFLDAAVKRAV